LRKYAKIGAREQVIHIEIFPLKQEKYKVYNLILLIIHYLSSEKDSCTCKRWNAIAEPFQVSV